ncbi:baseplate assembly protein [Maritalea porphyrae]|uniref:baseplate assembly protein n=1 Tax=Maritalea porphyrae TaxID=880732 RepID=UPI0022AFC34F|nr:baseplate J/gp47 family protein [Maritalea porphyrae]MCZ4270717.1 baseplate J/gp47 family protein [Maritalea porphyrae]
MSRYTAETLDLSRFPAPLAIRGVDYEAILADRMTRLVALFDDRDIDYDVAELETDPGKILQETDAYREMLVKSEINDAIKAVMKAFAVGSDLDHLALPLMRLEGELDEAFRRRVLLEPEAAGIGTLGGYIFHALAAHEDVANVDVWSPGDGVSQIAVQAKGADGVASAELVEFVRSYLHKDDIKPFTDTVYVGSVTQFDYIIDVEVFVLPGPDPLSVKALVEESLAKMAASRFTPARDIPPSAIHAAATVGPVDRVVINQPAGHIARLEGELGRCLGITVKVSTHDG